MQMMKKNQQAARVRRCRGTPTHPLPCGLPPSPPRGANSAVVGRGHPGPPPPLLRPWLCRPAPILAVRRRAEPSPPFQYSCCGACAALIAGAPGRCRLQVAWAVRPAWLPNPAPGPPSRACLRPGGGLRGPLPLSGSCAGCDRRAGGHRPRPYGAGALATLGTAVGASRPFFVGYRPDQRCGACPGFPFALPALAFARSGPAPNARQLQTFFVSRRGREVSPGRARPSGAAPSRGVRSDPRPPEPPALGPTRPAVFFMVLG